MQLRTLLSALLLSLLTTACATAPDEADDVSSAVSTCVAGDLQIQLDTVYLEDPRQPGLEPIAAQADPGLDTGSLCECADDSCVIDWIDASLGCGVCAHVLCGDGERGGCVPCVSIDEPAAASCVFADATVSARE